MFEAYADSTLKVIRLILLESGKESEFLLITNTYTIYINTIGKLENGNLGI